MFKATEGVSGGYVGRAAGKGGGVAGEVADDSLRYKLASQKAESGAYKVKQAVTDSRNTLRLYFDFEVLSP